MTARAPMPRRFEPLAAYNGAIHQGETFPPEVVAGMLVLQREFDAWSADQFHAQAEAAGHVVSTLPGGGLFSHPTHDVEPGTPTPTRAFAGIVDDAGGGSILLWVARETESYPRDGEHVLVIPVAPDEYERFLAGDDVDLGERAYPWDLIPERGEWPTWAIAWTAVVLAVLACLAGVLVGRWSDARAMEDPRTRAAVCQVLDAQGRDAASAYDARPCADLPAEGP